MFTQHETSIPPPTPPIPSNEYTTPTLPNKTIKKQPRVNLPKVIDNDHLLSKSQLHVDNSNNNPTSTAPKVETAAKIDISNNEPIVTPTADSLHQESSNNKGLYF